MAFIGGLLALNCGLMSQDITPSSLYVVATPIGNLEDITLRALDILRGVDVIYAEDTRVTAKLLHKYDIHAKVWSCREAMPRAAFLRVAEEATGMLSEGKSLAVVSDAGTPGISDPGNALVAEVIAAGYRVIPIPGPSALSAILSVSGLPIQRPLFVGFLPKKKGHQTLMGQLREGLGSVLCDALIFYESPERLLRFFDELRAWDMPLSVIVGRELTKTFEELVRGDIDHCADLFSKRTAVKGEVVVLVSSLSTHH